jgi:hypothetical protein
MNVELNSADLLVVAGNGAFIWMVLKLLVRPWFKPRAAEWWYPAAMNLIAVVIGLIGAIAAVAVLGFSYENILNGVLVALGGAVIAIGGNEMVENMVGWYSAKK